MSKPKIEKVEIYPDERGFAMGAGGVYFDFHQAKGTTPHYPNRCLMKVDMVMEEALLVFNEVLAAAYEEMEANNGEVKGEN